jgi:glyoxylase-like metal-dependent hydrolase (beta-lactamase superfamily II)/rhodanese-related sulfurtransferase
VAAAGTIAIEELLAAIDAGEPLLLLDVRNESDFATWRITGRRNVETLHVPYFRFLDDADADAIVAALPRDVPLVTVCAHGGSSALVTELLHEHGIAACNLDGGMAAYGAFLSPVRVATPGTKLEIWQLQRRARGCLSYVIRAGAAAVVVDPSRHVERYEAFVAACGARIELVVDTHLHADHVSGGATLAARNRAPYFVGDSEGAGLDAVLANQTAATAIELDGERIWLRGGDASPIELRLLATPGHTPEGHALLIAEGWLLSGDTILVHGVGRPDLGTHALEWGGELHHTITEHLAWLPDATVVLPAHAADAADAGPDGLIATTLGAVRRTPELSLPSAEAFARTVAASLTPPPAAYADIAAHNRDRGPIPHELADRWELGANQCAARPSALATKETS